MDTREELDAAATTPSGWTLANSATSAENQTFVFTKYQLAAANVGDTTINWTTNSGTINELLGVMAAVSRN